MAWNPSPRVATCRTVAREWKMDQVIILGINSQTGVFEVASYGETKALCSHARKICDHIYNQVQTGVIETPPLIS